MYLFIWLIVCYVAHTTIKLSPGGLAWLTDIGQIIYLYMLGLLEL